MSVQATTTQNRSAAAKQTEPLNAPLSLHHCSAKWQIDEEWQDHLLGSAGPDWFALERDNRATPVKTGHRRNTWRVDLADRTIYAKVYDLGGAVDRLKRLIGRDPARREWEVTREATRRGVPAIRPLGVGIQTGGQHGSVYLSESLTDAVSLSEAFSRARDTHKRSDSALLIRSAARLFALAHERGFAHEDGHPDNVLITTGKDGSVEARYVDLYAARLVSAPVSTQEAVMALAQLNHYFAFRRFASDMQRLRFLKVYLAERVSLGSDRFGRGSVESWAADVVRASARHAHQLARKRDRRLRRQGKYFATVKLRDGWKATVALKLERRHAFPEANVPDRNREQWLELLNSLITTLGEGGAEVGVFDGNRLRYEVSKPVGLMERLSSILTGSAQRRAFELGHRRRHRDLPAELILACLERQSAVGIDATALVFPNSDAAKIPVASDK